MKLTLSVQAHEGLHTLLKRPTHRSVLYRRKSEYVYDGTNIRKYDYEDDLVQPLHLEGPSHALNLLAMHYTYSAWQDTRPPNLKKQDTQYTFDYAQYGLQRPKFLSYRNRYYIPIDQDYERHVQEDPTPFTDLPEWEQEQRKQTLKQQRKPFEYSLTPDSKAYYYELATHFKMETPTRHHTRGAYVAAALEAIGIQYLTPPEGYQQLIQDTPNSHKARTPSLDHVHHKGKLYGNFAHTGWIPNKERWRSYPPLQDFTRADYEHAKVYMPDLAREALQINPSLEKLGE